MEKKSEKGVDKCGGLRYYFNPVLESNSGLVIACKTPSARVVCVHLFSALVSWLELKGVRRG
jgi:hypothetical protein